MQSNNTSSNLIAGKRALEVLRIMLVIGVAIILIYGLSLEYRVRFDAFAITDTVISPFGQVFSVGLAVGGAALMIGGFLGFLFGIPRTFQNVSDNAAIESEVRANTNLEQISDWLTKILVGVGLTQISEIPTFLSKLSASLETDLGHAPGSSAFGLGIVFYFLLCGFLIGFLWTRLFLPSAFREADVITKLTEQFEMLKRQPDLNARAKLLVDIQLEPRGDSTPPTPQELISAITVASADTRIEIGERARRTRKRAWENNDVDLIEKVIPVFEGLLQADKDNKDYLWHAQLGFAIKDRKNPDYARAESLLTEAIARRGSPREVGFLWYEINRALCIILQDPDFKAEKPSSDPVRQRIIADLKASTSEWSSAKPKIDVIEKWLALNNLTSANFQ